MRKIPADELTALGGTSPYNLVGVADAFDWTGNVKGPRVGSFYTILRANDLEKVRVLVRDSAPIVAAATLENVALTQFPKVLFENLTATISVNSKIGTLTISAEATAAKLVSIQKQ